MIADIPNFFSGNSHPEDEPLDVREADRVFVRGMTHHFLSLVGGVVDYYGADSGEHEFKIDGIVFKVFEDPDVTQEVQDLVRIGLILTVERV